MKWQNMKLTPQMLFTDILNNASNIQKLIVKELEMIAEAYHQFTGQTLPFKKSGNKVKKVNIISLTFGDKSTVAPQHQQMKNPLQLKSLAKKYIMKPSYPKDVIAAAAAKIELIKSIDEWEGKFTVPLEEYTQNTGEMYQSYYFLNAPKKKIK